MHYSPTIDMWERIKRGSEIVRKERNNTNILSRHFFPRPLSNSSSSTFYVVFPSFSFFFCLFTRHSLGHSPQTQHTQLSCTMIALLLVLHSFLPFDVNPFSTHFGRQRPALFPQRPNESVDLRCCCCCGGSSPVFSALPFFAATCCSPSTCCCLRIIFRLALFTSSTKTKRSRGRS